jgi:hypothetical protein
MTSPEESGDVVDHGLADVLACDVRRTRRSTSWSGRRRSAQALELVSRRRIRRLRDPLGSARSHGCVRLANDAISWLVRTIGRGDLPGTPVTVD